MTSQQKKKRFSFFVSPPRSPVLSPATNQSVLSLTATDPDLFDRANVSKSVDALERLVSAADTYRDLITRLTKASKAFSKALKEYGHCKGMEERHVMCLQSTSQFYDGLADVQGRLYKVLQKDFDMLMKFWDKYSKKAIKDERTHDNNVADLDKLIKKTGKDYEKQSKRDNKAAVESHEKYISTLTSLGSEIAQKRKEYAMQLTQREKRAYSMIAQIVCRLAEAQFASFNDSLKKCGPNITKMKEWAPFAGENMPPPQELKDLIDNDNKDDDIEQAQSETLFKISSKINIVSQASQSTLFGDQSSRESYSSTASSKQLTSNGQLSSQSLDSNPAFTEETLSFPIPPARPPNVKPASADTELKLSLDRLDSLQSSASDSITNASPVTPPVSSSQQFPPQLTILPRVESLINSPTSPPSPASPNQPLRTASVKSTADLISRFSIGIYPDDHPFMRDEVGRKVREASVITEHGLGRDLEHLGNGDGDKDKDKKTESEENVKTRNEVVENMINGNIEKVQEEDENVNPIENDKESEVKGDTTKIEKPAVKSNQESEISLSTSTTADDSGKNQDDTSETKEINVAPPSISSNLTSAAAMEKSDRLYAAELANLTGFASFNAKKDSPTESSSNSPNTRSRLLNMATSAIARVGVNTNNNKPAGGERRKVETIRRSIKPEVKAKLEADVNEKEEDSGKKIVEAVETNKDEEQKGYGFTNGDDYEFDERQKELGTITRQENYKGEIQTRSVKRKEVDRRDVDRRDSDEEAEVEEDGSRNVDQRVAMRKNLDRIDANRRESDYRRYEALHGSPYRSSVSRRDDGRGDYFDQPPSPMQYSNHQGLYDFEPDDLNSVPSTLSGSPLSRFISHPSEPIRRRNISPTRYPQSPSERSRYVDNDDDGEYKVYDHVRHRESDMQQQQTYGYERYSRKETVNVPSSTYRERSPERGYDLYSRRAYTMEVPKRDGYVSVIKDKLMASGNTDRRVSSPPRSSSELPVTPYGRVSDMAARFGGEHRSIPVSTHKDYHRYNFSPTEYSTTQNRTYRDDEGSRYQEHHIQQPRSRLPATHRHHISGELIPANEHCNCHHCLMNNGTGR